MFLNPNGENPVTIMPAVIVSIKSREGKAVFSYEAKMMEKTVAYSLENAQKKAFPKLSKKINVEIKF